jgi:hypothetical protein
MYKYTSELQADELGIDELGIDELGKSPTAEYCSTFFSYIVPARLLRSK